MTDVSGTGLPGDTPYRMPDQGAVDAWRQGTPASPMAPQSPLAAMGPPPAPTAGPPPQGHLNMPPMPKQPQLQQNKEPPPDQKEYQKDAMAWASAFAVLGALSGRFTRAPGGAALAAFGAAVKGWQSGNLQAYETASKEWEEKNKQALDNNKTVLEQYKIALEDRKMNIDEQMQQIQLISANYHDKIMYDLAQSKNFTGVGQAYEKGVKFTAEGGEAAAKLAGKRREEEAQQALVGERLASGQINPDGLDPQTGQPYTEQQKMYFKYTKEQYLGGFYGQPAGAKGGGKPVGGMAGQLVAQENSERTARGDPRMTAQEEISFIQQIHPPRSAPAMDIDQFKRDFRQKNGRDPNAQEISKEAARYTGEQAYARTAGGQGARVENASNEVEQLIPQAVEASRAYTREGGVYVGLNKLFQAYDQGKSDPKYNDFVLANFSLINAYTRAMNPQGVPRIQERLEQRAVGILSSATSEQTYEVQVRRLWKEVQASKTATAKTAQGRSPGDINSPVPGMDTPAGGGAEDPLGIR